MTSKAQKVPKKAKKLTLREAKLLKARLEGKPKGEAALAAGYSPKNPDQSGYQAMKNIQEKAPDLFARHGLDPDSFIQKHLLPRLNQNQVKCQLYEGEYVYSKPLEDGQVRMQATRLAAELLGLVVKERDTPATSIRVVVINAQNRPTIRGTPIEPESQ